MPRFLLGTTAYNLHVQQIALALHEAGALGGYYTGSVDHFDGLAGRLRQAVGRVLPPLDRLLRQRQIADIPPSLIHPDWGWEGLRSVGSRLGLSPTLQDWLWERGEHRLDWRCAALLRGASWEGFMGVEHGCLGSVQAARAVGTPSVVAFLSPHHSAYARWVTPEYERFPELASPSTQRLQRLAARRDARRDEEAQMCDVILSGSRFTTRTLSEAGISSQKIITVPLGSIPPRQPAALPERPTGPLRVIFAGAVAPHKGAHYLLQAWAHVAKGHPQAELHLYGTVKLPAERLRAAGPAVRVHGPVSQATLFRAFSEGALLVFPSLYDGFGMVLTEALAHGLPVLTTPNAGAADRIVEGENGFVVPPADADALAERLAWCLEHPAELFAMRPAAIASTTRHTWADFRRDLRRELGHALALPLSLPNEIAP